MTFVHSYMDRVMECAEYSFVYTSNKNRNVYIHNVSDAEFTQHKNVQV